MFQRVFKFKSGYADVDTDADSDTNGIRPKNNIPPPPLWQRGEGWDIICKDTREMPQLQAQRSRGPKKRDRVQIGTEKMPHMKQQTHKQRTSTEETPQIIFIMFFFLIFLKSYLLCFLIFLSISRYLHNAVY